MQIKKKHVIFGGLALLSLVAAGAYWQYTKFMEYCLTVARVKFNKLSLTGINMDLFLSFKNPSDLTIEINSQEYTVFINNKEFVKVTNPDKVVILKNATSEIPVNINFNPKGAFDILKLNAVDILSNRDKVQIKFDIKLKASLFYIPFSVPFTYVTNLKELTEGKQTAQKQEPKKGKKC